MRCHGVFGIRCLIFLCAIIARNHDSCKVNGSLPCLFQYTKRNTLSSLEHTEDQKSRDLTNWEPRPAANQCVSYTHDSIT